MTPNYQTSQTTLKTIVDFCRRKGLVYPSSEIYGGFAATYDLGPLGTILKQNLIQAWRDWMITYRTDTEEIEGAIFMHPKVWTASGHVGGFSDPLCEDLVTHKRYRADHLLEDAKVTDNAGGMTIEQINTLIKDNNLKSPDGNALSDAKVFNLLVKTHLGPVEDDSTLVYLKGEACQNIYINWKSIQETTRRKLPFGVGQLGKAFRNEITVKQFMFRTREFEQIDMQYFVKPGTETEWFQYWKEYRWNFYKDFLGFSTDNLQWHQHNENELVFYATDAWDIYYQFGQLGYKEMEGVHNRTDYDTRVHQEFSGTDLQYLDPITNEKYLPYVVEMSLGVSRLFLATLFEFYTEEQLENDTRIVMKLPFRLAPYKIAVLPLMKKGGMSEKAFDIYSSLKKQGISCTYDEAGSIGKRYRRQDENGTPWCMCVDFETLENNTVTLRHRDTMEQVRVGLDEVQGFLNKEKFER
jgi:glycyl-tRNA synthetase